MASSSIRRTIRNMNQYQKKILILAFAPCALLCVCISALLYLFFGDLEAALNNQRTVVDIAYVRQWGVVIMASLWFFFVCLIAWVVRASSHIVGAHERVKKELRDVSNGTRRAPISVREHDSLYREILEHINEIIKKLYERT